MRLADKIATMARRGAPLPYDAEVEYLESTGTQYIDTGLNTTTDHVSDFEIKGFLVRGGVDSATVFGLFGVMYGGTARYGWWNGFVGLNNSDCVDIANGTTVHTIKVFGGIEIDVDGSITQISGRSVRSNMGIVLFAVVSQASGTGSIRRCLGRIYNLKLYDTESNVVFEGLPVRFTNENVESEGAMYDRVSGRLFRNSGTGAFVIGPDVVSSRGGVLNV